MPESKLTAADVADVAKLARLSMEGADLNRIAGQLESILGYIDKLNGLDTSAIEGALH